MVPASAASHTWCCICAVAFASVAHDYSCAARTCNSLLCTFRKLTWPLSLAPQSSLAWLRRWRRASARGSRRIRRSDAACLPVLSRNADAHRLPAVHSAMVPCSRPLACLRSPTNTLSLTPLPRGCTASLRPWTTWCRAAAASWRAGRAGGGGATITFSPRSQQRPWAASRRRWSFFAPMGERVEHACYRAGRLREECSVRPLADTASRAAARLRPRAVCT